MKNIDIEKFFNYLKKEYELRTQADIARFFNESPQNIGNWKKRSFINENVVLAKIPNIELNMFLMGSTIEQKEEIKQQEDPEQMIPEREYWKLEGKYEKAQEEIDWYRNRTLLILEGIENKLTPTPPKNKKELDPNTKFMLAHHHRRNTGQHSEGENNLGSKQTVAEVQAVPPEP